jgi:hypothetical protein
MKSKGHLHIYIQHVFGKGQNKKIILTSILCSVQDESYKFLGLSLSSDSARLEKSYDDANS